MATGCPTHRSQRGVTLTELVVSIVVISVALSGTLTVMNATTVHSVDPMMQQQALAVSEAYLEEILLRPYADPDNGAVCPAPEVSRNLYDNVCDYDLLDDAGATDQDGNPVAGLSAYRVRVTVDTTANLNGLTGINNVLRVDARVTHPIGLDVTLSGYRTQY